MTKPTRGQWRGYAVLSVLLLVALLVLVLWPRPERRPPVGDHSALKEAVARYGDSIEAEVAAERRQWQDRYRRTDAERHYAERVHQRHYAEREHEQRPGWNRKPDFDGVIELNSADTTQLMLLRGIGSTFARRIVSYRALLGGYVRKEQLLEVYDLSRERYDAIAPHLRVDASQAVRLNVNTASLNELRRHPYIDYYQAKALMDYRRRGNRLGSMDDLRKVNLFDDTTVTKLQGYIQF